VSAVRSKQRSGTRIKDYEYVRDKEGGHYRSKRVTYARLGVCCSGRIHYAYQHGILLFQKRKHENSLILTFVKISCAYPST
jgi:hypothetical protein